MLICRRNTWSSLSRLNFKQCWPGHHAGPCLRLAREAVVRYQVRIRAFTAFHCIAGRSKRKLDGVRICGQLLSDTHTASISKIDPRQLTFINSVTYDRNGVLRRQGSQVRTEERSDDRRHRAAAANPVGRAISTRNAPGGAKPGESARADSGPSHSDAC